MKTKVRHDAENCRKLTDARIKFMPYEEREEELANLLYLNYLRDEEDFRTAWKEVMEDGEPDRDGLVDRFWQFQEPDLDRYKNAIQHLLEFLSDEQLEKFIDCWAPIEQCDIDA